MRFRKTEGAFARHHAEVPAGEHRREADVRAPVHARSQAARRGNALFAWSPPGLTYCVVGSEGIVRPCAYMTEEAGDVRVMPFDEIWKTSPRFARCAPRRMGAHAARAIIARVAEAVAPVRRITTKATFLRKTITALTA